MRLAPQYDQRIRWWAPMAGGASGCSDAPAIRANPECSPRNPGWLAIARARSDESPTIEVEHRSVQAPYSLRFGAHRAAAMGRSHGSFGVRFEFSG
jgi:hypothetical protein